MMDLHEIHSVFRQHFRLLEELDNVHALLAQCTRHIPQAKYNLREAEATLLEYGGLSRLLDRISGRYTQKLELLERSVRQCRDALAALEREKDSLNQDKTEREQQLKELPSEQALWSMAEAASEDVREKLRRIAVHYYSKKLMISLQENKTALENALQWARPNIGFAEEIREKQFYWYSQADQRAQTCRQLQETLIRFGQELEIHPYFTNPAGFILGAATQFRQLDRLNEALTAVRGTKKAVSDLLIEE